MNSRKCFENELELCSYLDGEIVGARGAALDDHMIICGQCSNQLLAWKQLKDLVHGSYSDVEAPSYIRERITLKIRALSRRDGGEPWIRLSESIQHPSDYPLSHASHFQPGDIEYPISATPSIQNDIINGKMGKTSPHIDGR